MALSAKALLRLWAHGCCWAWWLLCLPAARVAAAPPVTGAAARAPFFALLRAGDSVYAQRAGYRSLQRSLTYFDSAYALAARSRDTLLLAEAAFAKGRVYDAWNKEPAHTIAYFQQAATLFRRLPAAWPRYYYARYLLVHAYDKVPDTTGTVRAARALYRELRALPDSLRRRVPTTVELAWSCTEVGAYALADSVLRHLTRRALVHNDPDSYDHLTHYYLVRARLDLLHHHRGASAYLDSLDRDYQVQTALFDREYYSRQLAHLYAVARRYDRAYQRLAENRRFTDTLEGSSDIAQLRLALLRSTEHATEAQARVAAADRRQRLLLLGALLGGLLLLGLLSAYFYRQNRRNRAQAHALVQANQALDEKVSQVELLNKEIQHRIKNNLHMVFSLLQMQERRTTSEEAAEHLQAARLRVESIAALHNQLLRSPAGLNLGAYLRSLISNVVTCLANDKQIVTHLQTDVLHLPERVYLPLSLILNEWVTNSIKYAEPSGGGPLEVNVEVRQEPTQVCICYHDSGQPTPPNPPGLGSQLISLLSRQLGATLTTASGRPYDYELCIPHATSTSTVSAPPAYERTDQPVGR